MRHDDGDDEPLRLLPWAGQGDKSLYLSTDHTTGGRLARAADDAEAVQLQMAIELIGHSDDLLAQRPLSAREVAHLARCLTGSLRDMVRVAQSRGDRLR
ncbi:hypothetical protein ACFY12_13430 [Streptomyces sp. NPDC001339]|uniref:hypothetical protein n=1 Tax=Streptomyces sp. NPDC001339 TaxID=3364563 RepID=UPI0036B7F908